MQRDISLAEREAVKALHDKARQPTAANIEKAKLEGADKVRKQKMSDMKKLFRLCNLKYHPHLADEPDIHMRRPPPEDRGHDSGQHRYSRRSLEGRYPSGFEALKRVEQRKGMILLPRLRFYEGGFSSMAKSEPGGSR